MGGALARGLAEPMLVVDADPARAEALAAELGGEAAASVADLAAHADAIVLCHKPSQLADVAEEVGGRARAVISILGATTVTALELAYPGIPVFRFMPSIAAEVRLGALCYVAGSLAAEAENGALEAAVLERFSRLGTIHRLDDERLIEPATALMGCGPGFLALVIEALVDAGVSHGLAVEDATAMTVETMAGTAAVLAAHGNDPVALRRRVTSPGGSTAAGVAALESAGIRAAFGAAVGAAVGVASR